MRRKINTEQNPFPVLPGDESIGGTVEITLPGGGPITCPCGDLTAAGFECLTPEPLFSGEEFEVMLTVASIGNRETRTYCKVTVTRIEVRGSEDGYHVYFAFVK